MLTTKPLSFFKTDPKQPRKQFTESDLLSLGASIKNLGQLQPVGGGEAGWNPALGRTPVSASSLILVDRLGVFVSCVHKIRNGKR